MTFPGYVKAVKARSGASIPVRSNPQEDGEKVKRLKFSLRGMKVSQWEGVSPWWAIIPGGHNQAAKIAPGIRVNGGRPFKQRWPFGVCRSRRGYPTKLGNCHFPWNTFAKKVLNRRWLSPS